MHIEETVSEKIASFMLSQWQAWNYKIQIPSSKKQKQLGTKWAFIVHDQFGHEVARIKRAKQNNEWVICYEK
jgi:hypothetical protein